MGKDVDYSAESVDTDCLHLHVANLLQLLIDEFDQCDVAAKGVVARYQFPQAGDQATLVLNDAGLAQLLNDDGHQAECLSLAAHEHVVEDLNDDFGGLDLELVVELWVVEHHPDTLRNLLYQVLSQALCRRLYALKAHLFLLLVVGQERSMKMSSMNWLKVEKAISLPTSSTSYPSLMRSSMCRSNLANTLMYPSYNYIVEGSNDRPPLSSL